MRCVIMQPTYLPWAGYFHLISQADKFVFLDDVQFEKQSWQTRNRILLNQDAHWMIVAVKVDRLAQNISTITIDESRNWRAKHIKTMQAVYAKHPYKQELADFIDIIADTSITLLADMNIKIIKMAAEKLSLRPLFYRASDLVLGGKRSDHLLQLCRCLSCNEYISPVGSADYLAEDGVFEQSEVHLTFQKFSPIPYPQKGVAEFYSHLSIVDVVANLGWTGAAEYVRGAEGAQDERDKD